MKILNNIQGPYLQYNRINDVDTATIPGMYYAASSVKLPSGVNDCSLLVMAWSYIWVTQLIQDWRTGKSFTRVRNNGTWSGWNELSVSGHAHTKEEITDFPSSLPANGGNSDTVGGKYAADFALAGFGLGTICKSVTGDWNNHQVTGFYMGSNLTNQPQAINGSNTWWYVIVMQHNASFGWILQIATDFNSKATYRRAKVNGTWTGWTLLYSTDNKPSASDIGAAASSHSHTKSQITDMPTKLSQFTNDLSMGLIQTVSSTTPTSPSSGQVWIQLT